MHDTSSRSHPLKIPWTNHALVALEILMVESPLLHIGDGLKATVRVVGEACG